MQFLMIYVEQLWFNALLGILKNKWENLILEFAGECSEHSC